MLGEFLEISIETGDILASIDFYEKLGFVQARTGDTWKHPYAVLTDGRCVIGLHQYAFPSPSLTFVLPGLRDRVAGFEALDIEFEFLKLGETQFNEAGFYDPDGQMVCLLEARTYFRPVLEQHDSSLCGHFNEYRLPVRDAAASGRFWEKLGFVRDDEDDAVIVACTGLTLQFDEDRRLRFPQFVFHVTDLAEHLTVIEQRGIASMRKKRGSATLRAPEGTELLLLAD